MTLSDHELLELLHADRPAPDPRFTTELDRRVEQRFAAPPSPEGARWRPRLSAIRPFLLPAMGVAASALIALVLVLPAIRGSGDAETASSGATGGSAEIAPAVEDSTSDQALTDDTAGDAATAAPDEVTPSLPPAASGGGTSSAPSRVRRQKSRTPSAAPLGATGVPNRERKVEKSATLTLAPEAKDLAEVGDGVIRATDRAGGFVQDSSLRADDSETGGGQFTLRVPTAKLDALLAELSRLAHVQSREQSARDITSSFDRAQDRLDQARAERRALLRRLEKATTDIQVAALRSQLRSVAGRIESAERSVNRVRRQADLATVSVTLVAASDEDDGAGIDDGRWGITDAIADAGRLLEGLAGVLIIGLALSLPFVPLALLAQVLRRRSRERALDLA